MAATKYGNGNYGLSSESANGLYAARLTFSASESDARLRDHVGDTVGLVLYDQEGTITMEGATVTAHTQGQTLGGVMGTIANAAIFGTDGGITRFYVNGIDLTSTNNDFQTGNFTAIGFAGVTAASGTEIS